MTPGSAAGFLTTGHQQLEAWMDERFRVRYENMPLQIVFEQKPISDIRYELQNLPADPPLFYLVSPSISRRELLKEIATFYRLDMRVEMANGEPSSVIVTGRGPAGGGLMRAEAPPVPEAVWPVGALPYRPDPGQQGVNPRAGRVVEEGQAVPLASPNLQEAGEAG